MAQDCAKAWLYDVQPAAGGLGPAGLGRQGWSACWDHCGCPTPGCEAHFPESNVCFWLTRRDYWPCAVLLIPDLGRQDTKRFAGCLALCTSLLSPPPPTPPDSLARQPKIIIWSRWRPCLCC